VDYAAESQRFCCVTGEGSRVLCSARHRQACRRGALGYVRRQEIQKTEPMPPRKTLRLIRAGNRNIGFQDLCRLAEAFGFVHDRTSGSHHIYNHPHLPGLLNLQPEGGQAKPYQVRQLMKLIEKYGLKLASEADEK
jgi:hypothetical protein